MSFGDQLRPHVIEAAARHAQQADLVLSLGSTMSVSPACHLVAQPAEASARRLVVGVRQATELDGASHVRSFGDCDALMEAVMEALLGEAACGAWRATLWPRSEARRAELLAQRAGGGKKRGDVFVMKV